MILTSMQKKLFFKAYCWFFNRNRRSHFQIQFTKDSDSGVKVDYDSHIHAKYIILKAYSWFFNRIEGRTFTFNLLKIQIQVFKLIMILTSM